ncbi:MAG: hypothetical protein ABW128_03570, partial [Rhizorhabdus sp.]
MIVEGNYVRDGHALLRGFVPPEICSAFLNQVGSDVESRGQKLTDLAQGSALLKRDAVELYGYHYPPMLGFLWGLTPAISSIVGRDLLPTYDYFRIYREGDICRVHSDRPSCEVSLSLTLDYSDGVPWPIEMGLDPVAPQPLVEETFAGARYKPVEMMPGDAVLYQGVHRRHGRMTPNPNLWSAHLFCHWVDRN